MKDMNRTEFDIILSRDHVLIDCAGGMLLIDTGSPYSFHRNACIQLGGREYPVPISLMGVDAAYIADKVGQPVSGLLGMDIIGKIGLKIDIPGGKLSFFPSVDGMVQLPSGMGMGYSYVDMTVAGKPARVVLDTGAPTSYVSKSFTEGLDPVGRITDFNPLIPGDTFETPVFEFPASFAGKAFSMKAGHLPGSLQLPLSMLGADGVVGMEILKRFAIVIADGSVWM